MVTVGHEQYSLESVYLRTMHMAEEHAVHIVTLTLLNAELPSHDMTPQLSFSALLPRVNFRDSISRENSFAIDMPSANSGNSQMMPSANSGNDQMMLDSSFRTFTNANSGVSSPVQGNRSFRTTRDSFRTFPNTNSGASSPFRTASPFPEINKDVEERTPENWFSPSKKKQSWGGSQGSQGAPLPETSKEGGQLTPENSFTPSKKKQSWGGSQGSQGGKQQGWGGSQQSSTASDATTAFAEIMQVLHIDASHSQKHIKHPALGKLRNLCYVSFFLVFVFSWLGLGYPKGTAFYIEHHLMKLSMASSRQSLISSIVVLSGSISSGPGTVLGNSTELIALLSDKATQLHDVHRDLHFDYDESVEVIPIDIIDKGRLETTSLWAAANEFVLKARLIAAGGSSEGADDDNLDFLRINGMGSLAETCYSNTFDRKEEDQSNVLSQNNNLPLFIGFTTFVILGMTCWMCLVASRIQGYNNLVFKVLRDIPRNEQTRIKEHYAESLVALQEYSSVKVRLHNARENMVSKRQKKRNKADKSRRSKLLRSWNTIMHRLIPDSRLVFLGLQLFSLFMVFCVFEFNVWTTNGGIEESTEQTEVVFYGAQWVVELYTIFHLVRSIRLSTEEEGGSLEDVLNSRITRFKEVRDIFVFGGESSQPVDDGRIVNLIYEDGCSFLMEGTDDGQYDECSSFGSEVFRSGIYTASLEFIDLTEEVASSVGVGGSKSTDDDDALYLKYEAFALRYLIPSAEYIAARIVTSEIEALSLLKSSLTLLAGMGVFILIGLWWFVYRRVLRGVSEMLRHNDSLPLLVPYEIAFHCEELKRFFLATK
jgi:hypothetical protein